ncbi:hypothetical protein TIFTF001_000595 [Ficus carica]|uniref:Uncharacterized protein n=1 Tax=Ficus carica TaxID=3494 RepID=A0AA88CPH6_FICCA|nr:hypothetical protein TIFTF001_000595 [Ficus carica]
MENQLPKLNHQPKRNPNPPPRRGQIKIRIIKSLFSSVAATGGRKPGENGGPPSPIASPPAATPSGYASDAES